MQVFPLAQNMTDVSLRTLAALPPALAGACLIFHFRYGLNTLHFVTLDNRGGRPIGDGRLVEPERCSYFPAVLQHTSYLQLTTMVLRACHILDTSSGQPAALIVYTIPN